ncbi:MAG TPA: Gfo/Idh/MocA family oxidoreductase [Opitutus sp.]|nr:Gfo/Idh/MocA family oxidoreductase [Opitutus sp.]
MLPPVATSLSGAQTQEPSAAKRRLGVALLGLGGYSRGQLAPALQETEWCRLAGVVTGTPSKAEEWQKKYELPAKNVYSYDTFDRIADNPDIDIVYIVCPNGLHAEFAVRAAKAGKHVICEKPMATTIEDCDRIMQACAEAKRKLSIGYRLHFEPHNVEVMRWAKTKEFGAVKRVEANDAYVSRGGGWRHDPKLAGGPLMDLGVYCVQAGCYGTGEEPIAVTAREEKTDRERFAEVEETIYWTMEFPSGAKAECMMSYNKSANNLRVEAENGWYELSPAYAYRGIQGRTSRGPMNLPQVNQQARQMDAFARCILDGTETTVPGSLGRRDVKIMLAIYESARTGKRVTL